MNADSEYVVGIDFGTQSARSVLAGVTSGRIVDYVIHDYRHGVLDSHLPDGTPLERDWALQHPGDYLEALEISIPLLLAKSEVSPENVIGLSIACTSSTVLPITEAGTPLCLLEEFRSHPHAYVKLWKHHAAQPQADRLNRLARARQEPFLDYYGGKTSCEWLFPKLMQLFEEAPGVFDATGRFMEAGDWITMRLTGQERRSRCGAGYKALWHPETGYPSRQFFAALYPSWETIVEEKLGDRVYGVGSRAGTLTPAMAQRIGLETGTAVGVATIDAHAAVPGMGITEPGHLLMIMGTSTCHMLLHRENIPLEGIAGVAKDGIVPGFWGYEAGQACVGDHFQWLVDHFLPTAYEQEARDRGLSVHALLQEKAARLQVGESGLLALDWWNGNRSVLMDAELSGLMLGLTLKTRAEDIYRALIEATAFGTKLIIDNFEKHQLPVEQLSACGGIAEKDRLMLEIYADVTGRPIHTSFSPHTVALGAAVLAAVAAGPARGGYDSIEQAVRHMIPRDGATVEPSEERRQRYQELYEEYRVLHDYFGRGSNDVMKRLRPAQPREGERGRCR